MLLLWREKSRQSLGKAANNPSEATDEELCHFVVILIKSLLYKMHFYNINTTQSEATRRLRLSGYE